MKISKIIFLSLIGVIALFIFAGALDIRINGVKRSLYYENMNKSKTAIPPFKVLRINSSNNISVIQSDSSYIQVSFQKDSLPPTLNYTINEDTLIISDSYLGRRNAYLTLYATTALNKFYLKNSNVTLNSFFGDKCPGNILMDLDYSSVDIYPNKKNAISLTTIDIIERNESTFHGSNFKVDSLNISLQNSQADLSLNLGKISGNISDKSRLYFHSACDISIKRDASSKIGIY